MKTLPDFISDPKEIRSNQRFSAFAATYKNETVFVKQLHDPSLEKALRAEVWGITTFTELAQVQEFSFAIPKVLFSSDTVLITTWCEGAPLVLEPQNSHYNEYLSFFAKSYAQLDHATALAHPLPTSWYRGDDGQPLTVSLVKRLSGLDYSAYFADATVEQALAYISKNLPQLEARLTHADFNPANVMVAEHGTKTLVDYESTSLLWPRYYDVVNTTINRQILEPELLMGMAELFNEFARAAQLDIDRSLTQLNTIAAVRIISLIIECTSQPDALHNTQFSMTPAIAKRLQQSLDHILKNELYLITG